MSKCIGILTSGGDNPGLNAAIRGIGKTAIESYGMHVIGFKDGFRGLAENRVIQLNEAGLSGILTLGGTILGTSRDKPHKMPIGDKILDMTDVIVENYHKNHLDALVCIGGDGTQKNAYKLLEKGLNIITLPKTIDNDIGMTDTTIGFNTALGIATEAVDRLHSTAHSHHRVILVEVMGHKAGWLAIGSGIAGGADVILIPEIPYDVNVISNAIKQRRRRGKHFSIIVVAEGALSVEDAKILNECEDKKKNLKNKKDKKTAEESIISLEKEYPGNSVKLANQIQSLTMLDTRVTILGYVQRGGTPSAEDRVLATRLGTACAQLINKGEFGVMVAAKGNESSPVALDKVAGNRKMVPLDHPWVESARMTGICLGN